MARAPAPTVFDERTLEGLTIEDESSFRHVGLYGDLKQVLRRVGFTFRVMPASAGMAGTWERALLLNLTYWQPDAGGDVLVDEAIPADVITHVAWHHLAAGALASKTGQPPSVAALFMGEAIASAFDLYLVGRLLGHAPDSSFLATQVPAMSETAEAAGVNEAAFATMLADVAAAPERAFADLRALLFDAAMALYASRNADQAFVALRQLDGHRFAPLLHRYELSNWVLYARAYGDRGAGAGAGAGMADPEYSAEVRARELDRELRQRPDPLAWLAELWVRPVLVG